MHDAPARRVELFENLKGYNRKEGGNNGSIFPARYVQDVSIIPFKYKNPTF